MTKFHPNFVSILIKGDDSMVTKAKTTKKTVPKRYCVEGHLMPAAAKFCSLCGKGERPKPPTITEQLAALRAENDMLKALAAMQVTPAVVPSPETPVLPVPPVETPAETPAVTTTATTPTLNAEDVAKMVHEAVKAAMTPEKTDDDAFFKKVGRWISTGTWG